MSHSTTRVHPGQMASYGALPVPELTPELLTLVRTGSVYSLAVVYYEGMPVPGVFEPYSLTPRVRHGDLTGIGPVSGAGETIKMAAHTGTHIDALCHIAEYQDTDGNPVAEGGEARLFDGKGRTTPAAEHVTFQGQTHLSIAEMPPIITRGVLLDVAGYKGVAVLPDCYVITAEDIQGTLAKQGSQVRPGTAVLTRTGFYHHMRDGNPAFTEAIAGLGLEAAKLLVGQGMILAGADNLTVEPMPPPDHDVHRFHLVHNGITHLEVLFLEELAEKKIYEFLLIVTPLRLQGSTGSWVHPIAIT